MSKGINFEQALFQKPHFEAKQPGGENGGSLPPDPTVPTRMKITLDQLIPYPGNPRTAPNPEYADIKESIRNRGLDHTPNVTRPSPDQPFMVKDGGNTRLQILNELWQETGDPRFQAIDCMFFPWKGERDVLIAHMIENEMRGGMTLIDRARAAVRLKVDLEQETGKSLSGRELATMITNMGWTLRHQHLSAMLYAVEHLEAWIPNALNEGLGRPSINKVRKLLDNAQKYWESVATEAEGSFDAVWQPIFKELDRQDCFDADFARDKLEEEIARRLEAPLASIKAEIQAVELGYSEGGHRPTNPFSELDQDQSKMSPSGQPATVQPARLNQPAPPKATTPPAIEAARTVSPKADTAPAPFGDDDYLTNHETHTPDYGASDRNAQVGFDHEEQSSHGAPSMSEPSTTYLQPTLQEQSPEQIIDDARRTILDRALRIAELGQFLPSMRLTDESHPNDGLAIPFWLSGELPPNWRDHHENVIVMMIKTGLYVWLHDASSWPVKELEQPELNQNTGNQRIIEAGRYIGETSIRSIALSAKKRGYPDDRRVIISEFETLTGWEFKQLADWMIDLDEALGALFLYWPR